VHARQTGDREVELSLPVRVSYTRKAK
jgi:hypothetical protein